MLLLPREMYLRAGDGNKLLHDLKMQLEKEAVPLRALSLSVYIYIQIYMYTYIVFIHCPAPFGLRNRK